MIEHKRILICPLDWGLGHATRCIPIIRLLLKKNAEVIIAADGRPLELLKQEFPSLKFIPFKGYDISYTKSDTMAFKMLLSIPKILNGIKKEHTQLDKLIDEHKIDCVISDNRYGCWSKKIKSIFITHQLMIKAPFGENMLHRIILKYIRKYDECWVPDIDDPSNLSGDLSHKFSLPENTFFIGALSRFENKNNQRKDASTPPDSHRDSMTYDYDVLAIISGPEPQRSIFERLVTEQLFKSNLKSLIVFGLPDEKKKIEEKGIIKMVAHLNSSEMENAILNSKIILSRSGYSTVMDLAVMNKKAIFIPTPGQTEQEYLSKLFLERGIAYSQNQSTFNLLEALKESENYSGFKNFENNHSLEQRIDFTLSSK